MSKKEDAMSKQRALQSKLRVLQLLAQALVELTSDDDTSAVVAAKPTKKKVSKNAPQSLRLVPKNAS
jgi:hypothetical protein